MALSIAQHMKMYGGDPKTHMLVQQFEIYFNSSFIILNAVQSENRGKW